MNWLKMNRGKISTVLIVALLLSIAYFSSGEAPRESNDKIKKEETKNLVLPQKITDSGKKKTEVEPDTESETDTVSESKLENEKESTSENEEKTEEESASEESNAEEAEKSPELKSEIKADEIKADEIKADAEVSDNNEKQTVKSAENPEKEQTAEENEKGDEKRKLCTLSVRCDTINQNLELLDKSKQGLIPTDGVIFNKNISFEEGESVFDVLLREMKNNKIHFEYVDTPMYNSVYIEGINNIYEFDCGAGSGWLYKVNGKFPSCGCSQYILENSDVIEIVYTCNMGKDVGRN